MKKVRIGRDDSPEALRRDLDERYAREDAQAKRTSVHATDDDRLEAVSVIAQAVLGVGVKDARFVADGIFDYDRAVECVADVLARHRLASLANRPADDGEREAKAREYVSGADHHWGCATHNDDDSCTCGLYALSVIVLPPQPEGVKRP